MSKKKNPIENEQWQADNSQKRKKKESLISKIRNRDFPSGPVVETFLPVQRVWVQCFVMELRSHMPCGQKNKT